jgi:hypothetical protein
VFIYRKSLGKKAALTLQEARALMKDTRDYEQGDSRTIPDHKSMLNRGMTHLKSVFQHVIDEAPVNDAEIGTEIIPPPIGSSGSAKGYKLTKEEQAHCQAAHDIAAYLGTHTKMHRAGRAMLKHAAEHIKSVSQILIDPKSASPDDLAGRLIGRLMRGKRLSPSILGTLKEVVDDRMDNIGDIVIEQAIDSGELLP